MNRAPVKSDRNVSGNIRRAEAAKVGEPTLVDPHSDGANEVMQEAAKAAMAPSPGSADSQAVSVETVGTGAPGPINRLPVQIPRLRPTRRVFRHRLIPRRLPLPQPDPNELKPNRCSGPERT